MSLSLCAKLAWPPRRRQGSNFEKLRLQFTFLPNAKLYYVCNLRGSKLVRSTPNTLVNHSNVPHERTILPTPKLYYVGSRRGSTLGRSTSNALVRSIHQPRRRTRAQLCMDVVRGHAHANDRKRKNHHGVPYAVTKVSRHSRASNTAWIKVDWYTHGALENGVE